MITCLNRKEIEDNNGKIINNIDGTISVYNNAGIPTLLTKPCCEAIGGIFDVDTQKCMWSKKSSESSPFNIILNPRGNSGEIFYVTPDEACTLQVSFDFLFKFNCEALKTMNSDSVITMFESIFAGMTINTKNGTSIDKVYEETIFNKIGTGNCYTYISSAGTDTGFYICGDLSENTVTNDCLPLNLYSLKTNNGTLDCKNAQQFIVEGLFKQSGLATTEFDQFKFNINENAFASNWLNFKTEITDASVLSAITNQKIVLAIKVSGAPEHLSILIDNIELNKVCKKLGKTTFLSSSPGFELDRIKDNKKSWVANTTRTHREFDINRYDDTLPIRQTDYYLDDERQVINTKEIDLDINLAHAVESDVWCYITSNPCILTGNTVGTTICSGQVSTQIYTSTTATDGVTTYSCPAGYTATTGNEQCQKITTTGSTFYGTSYTCQLSLSGVKTQYNNSGAVFYEKIDLTKTPISTSGTPSAFVGIFEPLFYGNGTGTSFTVQSRVTGTSNTLWVNNGPATTTKGRLNNAGIFSSTAVSGTTPQFIGFSHCLNIPVGGTYSLGICGDNYVKLKINGQQVVNFDKWSANFGFWHVFPIDLKSGLNIIELSGADGLGPPTNYTVASFAAEIYSASTTVLSALTTTIQLEPYIVFSTKNKVGSTFDIGDSSGYYCPSGYVLDTCNGYSCVKIENAPITATTTAGTIASSGTFCSFDTLTPYTIPCETFTAITATTRTGCPAGYTATTGNEQCQKITVTGSSVYPIIYTGVSADTATLSAGSYNRYGARFYEKIDLTKTPINIISGSTCGTGGDKPLYYNNGSGTTFNLQATKLNTIWGDGNVSYTNGRLNKIGIWASTSVTGVTDGTCPKQFIGFSHCLDIASGGTYSIGIAGNNYVRFKINGQQIVNFDKWYSNFYWWHVFPIDLKSGLNVIELTGADESSPADKTYASFGAEIYSASTSVLSAVTSNAELEQYIVFSTKDKFNTPFDIGESSGYYCPSGYVLSTCNGYTCVKIENLPFTAYTQTGYTYTSPCAPYSGQTAYTQTVYIPTPNPSTYCCSDSCGDKPIDINRLLTQPLSAVTTIEDFEYFLTSELIDAKNRQTITSYPTLRLLYDRYMNSLNYCGIKSSAFDYYTMEKFSKLIGNYWTDLIEQVIPATTIWNSTKVYTNTIFDEQKYKYKGYTSLFGTNPCDDVVPLSPTTGTSCFVDVKTVFVQGGPQNTLQFLRELNVSEYNIIYLLQMNSSNEFLGNVSSTNRSSSCYNIAECTLAIDITHFDETYPLNNGSATVNIYGANGTPSILWSNNQTTNTITGLSGGTYSVKVTDSVCDKTASVTIKSPTLAWSALTLSCETETTFAIRKTISGLSSPFSAFYYTGTTPSRVYIADADSTKGNIYWFDPKTATTESHMTYYPNIKANNVYTTFFDSKYLRAYLIGSSMTTPGGASTASTIDVSGLTVYDITGNTHYVVPYGSNAQYKRQTILVTNDYIFTIDSTISPSGGYRRFNRANPLSANTAIPYPSGQLSYWKLSTGGDGAPQPFEVGDKIWLIAGSGNNNGNIGIFDTSFNYLTQIVLPVKTYTGFTTTDKYWQNGYYDKTYNRFYVNEVNGKYRYVFEPNAQYTGATCIMSGSVTPYLENKKSFVSMSWSLDPVTNKLYNIFALGNNELDSNPIYKTYEINRSSGELLKLYSGYSFAELVQVNDGLFDSLAGTQAGSVYWQGGTAWSSDGQVVIYNNSISGNTTGRVSVKTLELYSNNNPTGTIKDNQIGTEGYIAPYTDYTTCPPYFDLRCPTILKTASGTTAGYAEVQLAQSVQNNPVITKITVSALTSGYSAMTSTSYTPPFSGYTFVTFTGLPATLGNVGVTYYSGGSPSYVQLSACTT